MNIIEIKALKAGSGKTTVLTQFFKESRLPNKIILTPSNKARQGCIQKLCENYSLSYEEATKYVKTVRSFKKNYVQLKQNDEDSEEYLTISSRDHISYEPFNIFIDEASMISDFEMKDLVKHWRIQNLILDGDCLQFEPIGGKQAILDASGEVVKTETGEILFYEDSGELYNLPVNHQILLTKQFRAHDEALLKVIDLIKKGELIEALSECTYIKDCQNESTDWHIAYTNNRCDKLNSMYSYVSKYIVAKDDKMHGFFTSEIIQAGDTRLAQLENQLIQEAVVNPDKKIPNFNEWKRVHLKPAYAITCHKLQGSTIDQGDIYIHIDDILLGLKETITDEMELAKLFQKFLYVAISRATSIRQIHIYGLGVNIDELMHIAHSDKTSEFKDKCTDCINELFKVDSLCSEMIDTTIRDDAVQFQADDKDLLNYLESVVDYEVVEDEMYLKWKEEHYGEEFSEAQKGKHSKPHKPHKQNWTQEMLEDSKKLSFTDWAKKYNKSNTLYYKLKKM